MARWAELGAVAALALPTLAAGLLGQALLVAAQMLIGRSGDTTSLAANGLATMLFNACYFFLNGATTALDTLASQAHGAGDALAVSLWTRRAVAFLAALLLPCAALMGFAGPVLEVAFRVPPALSAKAQRLTLPLLPGLAGFAYFSMFQKVLALDGVLLPPVLAAAAGNALFVAAALSLPPSLRASGEAVCWLLSLSRALMAAVTYLVWRRRDQLHRASAVYGEAQPLVAAKPQQPFPRVLDGAAMSAFARLAISGGCMVALEAWSFDLTTAEAAASQGEVGLAAHQTMLMIVSLTFLSTPFAVSIAATLRVGTLLGRGDAAGARRANTVCTAIVMAWMGLTAAGFLLGRNHIGALFSPDPELQRTLSGVAPVVALFQLVDGFQAVQAGTLRGMGRQSQLACWIFFSLWAVGLPSGAILTFAPATRWLGIRGIWYGFSIGLGVQSLAVGTMVHAVDWEAEARRAGAGALCARRRYGG